MINTKAEFWIFDLDFTVYECFDKHKNRIWAKQLVEPFTKLSEESLVDDVGSVCLLKTGIRTYLEHLSKIKVRLGFITNARHKALPDEFQPATKALLFFDLLDYFNDIRIIQYKTESKIPHLSRLDGEINYFDDDDHILTDCKKISGLVAIDAKIITDYSLLM